MASRKKIFAYTSEESRDVIEGSLSQFKNERGVLNAFMIEKWLLQGIASEPDCKFKERAERIINERYHM